MKQHFKYYRVYKNQTAVELVSFNDFILTFMPQRSNSGAVYTLPPDKEMFCACTDLVSALEKAKAGALVYIGRLIEQGDAGLAELLQYRIDHYEDLNVNLLDGNIREIEDKLKQNIDFKWIPYRIKTRE